MTTTIEQITELVGKDVSRKLGTYASPELLKQALKLSKVLQGLSQKKLISELATSCAAYEREQTADPTNSYYDFALDALIAEADRRDGLVHEEECPALGATWSNVLIDYRRSRGQHSIAEEMDHTCTCRHTVVKVVLDGQEHLMGPFDSTEQAEESITAFTAWAKVNRAGQSLRFSTTTALKVSALIDRLG